MTLKNIRLTKESDRLGEKSFRAGGRRALCAGAAVVVALVLSACGTTEPEVVEPVVTTPQASLEGEWVVSRTVTASNDLSNPDRAVGAVTTRLVGITQKACETALCPGTVESGMSIESRQSTDLIQTDGGLEWVFTGTLNCLNVETGLVQVADAFEFTQAVSLQVTETTNDSGEEIASKLDGEMTFSDSLSLQAHKAGCKRQPTESSVQYTLTAVRVVAEAPVAE